MKVSVVIPTKDRREYLIDMLSDLEQQTYPVFEVILSDQSEQFIQIKNTHNYKLIHFAHTGKGPCISRNDAAEKASGDILVFLDDDARVDSSFIEELIAPIVSGNFMASAGANCDPKGNYLYDDGEFLVKNDYNFIKSLTRNPNAPTSRVTLSFPGCCCAIKREVFFEIGGYDERFDPTGAGEDREMAINLFKNGYGIWYNAKAKFLHFGAEKGGSRDVGSRTLMLDLNSIRICHNHFSKELTSTLAKEIINKYRQSFIHSLTTFKLMRTKYRLYKKAKDEVVKILNENRHSRKNNFL